MCPWTKNTSHEPRHPTHSSKMLNNLRERPLRYVRFGSEVPYAVQKLMSAKCHKRTSALNGFCYSIASSVCESSELGTLSSRALAVLRLTTSSKLVGA